ncbi:MAG: hypothetical protein NW237_12180 [Cyanobacteriota bacterium]|nr:hypothetical protein [Cyanobacteriota bacterium]
MNPPPPGLSGSLKGMVVATLILSAVNTIVLITLSLGMYQRSNEINSRIENVESTVKSFRDGAGGLLDRVLNRPSASP